MPNKKSGRGSGLATLGDVAKLAGVAPITVSRFVRDPKQVSEALRVRIEAAIAQVDYVPNLIAQGLARACSSAVVAIMPSLSHSVFSQTVDVLSQRLQAHGYQLLLGNAGYSLEEEERLLRTFLHWRPAALILTGHKHTLATQKMLARAVGPVIETWDLNPDSRYFQVGFSHRQAGAAMANYLLDRGYQRTAYVHNCLVDDLRSAQRGAGYTEALQARGAQGVIAPAQGLSPFDAGRDALLALMAGPERPDAIFFANDNLAAGALFEAQRRGWRVPDEIAIAGFGGFPLADKLVPALTTLQPFHQRIGQIAADIVLRHYGLDHGALPSLPHVDVGFEIAARQSA